MGEAKLNPRSFQGKPKTPQAARAVYRARIEHFWSTCPDRGSYERFCDEHGISAEHRAFMEDLLPPHLQAQGTV